MSYIGVDLHQNSITLCRREADGTEAFETLTLSPGDMDRFCGSLDADDEVAIEATGNSAWFRDQILPCVGRVVVVNPSQFKVIRKSVKKTDKNDAAALALFLCSDEASFITGTGFMKWIPMKRSGRSVWAASRVIEIDEVLVARIASGFSCGHSCA